jgi:TRAP-type C4-dicarboxylate transport system permease large subunit
MFTHALLILTIMAVTFTVSRLLKLTVELSMFLAAIFAAIFHCKGIPVRHIVEGAFTYFDVCLIFITATFFVNTVKEAGGITFMVRRIVSVFHKNRFCCLLLLTVILLIPGALTGAGAATVLTVGSLVGSVLLCMGVSRTRAIAIIFLCASMSAAAPPVNLWAMMAAAGSNMPYVGFGLPLAVLSITGALLSMFILAGKGQEIDLDTVLAELPTPPDKMNWFRVTTPFLVFILLVLAGRVWPFQMPILGLPLIFLISSLFMIFLSPVRFNILDLAAETIRSLIPLVGIMIVVGILIQVMALSGARGFLSLIVVSLPLTVLFASLFIILPVSEGFLQYAVAPLIGVPLILLFNMKGLNAVIALSAMSVMWPLGDCLPPTAVVGRAAVMTLDFKGGYYKDFLKTCLLPMGLILGLCTATIIFSSEIDSFIRSIY